MKINDKSFPNEGKLSIQFPKLEKKNLVLFDHQLLKINRILGIEKKNLKKFVLSLYHPKLVYQHLEFWKKISFYNFQCKDIYTLSRKVTINTYLRLFQ